MSEATVVSARGDALTKADEWIARRDCLLSDAAIVNEVVSDDQLNAAGRVQAEISKHIKELDKERKAYTAPIDKVKKEIMACEKTMRADLEAEFSRLKKMNDAYATEVARKADEERRRREAEEHKAAMEAVECQREAEEAFGPGVAVEEVPVVEPEPVKKTVKTEANRMVKRWSYELVDLNKVPRELLSLDSKKVNAYLNYCKSQDRDPAADGIRFTSRMSVESR